MKDTQILYLDGKNYFSFLSFFFTSYLHKNDDNRGYSLLKETVTNRFIQYM